VKNLLVSIPAEKKIGEISFSTCWDVKVLSC
jgi:hypothetical protein